MPTVLKINGYRFKFFSNENNEPPHIHIIQGDGDAKYWLIPDCIEEYAYSFTIREKRDINKMITENRQFLIDKYHEHIQ
jgi:hypothetical protein